MTVNRCTLVGNLGADPEVRTTQSGTSVANLRLATTSRVKKGDNWEDETEWHRVVCFGKTAENVGRFLEKGRQIYVEGRIHTNKWTDKEGKERYTTEIIANQVRFLGGKNDSGGGGRSSGGGSGSSSASDYGGGSGGGSGHGNGPKQDDGIPFVNCCNEEPAWVRRLI